nr:nucleoside-diphosphate sugar epimerase/dehydratase [Maliibacterium massiliense]
MRRHICYVLFDVFSTMVAVLLSMLMDHGRWFTWPQLVDFLPMALMGGGVCVAVYWLFGIYRYLWTHAGINESVRLAWATLVALVIFYFLVWQVFHFTLRTSILFMIACLMLLFAAGSRLCLRLMLTAKMKLRAWRAGASRNVQDRRRTLIIGAGAAGGKLLTDLQECASDRCEVVGLVDDDPMKWKQVLHGVRVLGDTRQINRLVKEYEINEIIIAIPSLRPQDMTSIIGRCPKNGVRLRIMPYYHESDVDRNTPLQNVREVRIDDLLGRKEREMDVRGISSYIDDKVVLVTGGGGSIGSELCRQIMRFHPKEVVVFDMYENTAYELRNELMLRYGSQIDAKFTIVIGTIQDKERLRDTFARFKPDVVFHAAAYKHVPLMEDAPREAVKNNIFGTYNVICCADEYHVQRFVMISTDKAVNPTNIMGATKRVAEMLIQAMDKVSDTEFVAVRFGNVLGSNGSVVPLFQKQIDNGGPVTVTHPDITRYFMSIPEAAKLVLEAGGLAKGGEIFILDMGEPVKILDLARNLIRLSGYEPDVDIPIIYTGLRPGEKLYEELLLAEEGISYSSNHSIFIGKPMQITKPQMDGVLARFEAALAGHEDIVQVMQEVLPNYTPSPNEHHEI